MYLIKIMIFGKINIRYHVKVLYKLKKFTIVMDNKLIKSNNNI